MNIYAKEWTPVRLVKLTGNKFDIERSNRHLCFGYDYSVDYTEVLQSGNRVYLKGFHNIPFACHHFKEV